MQQWENKMDIRAECIGSLAFDQFCSGSLANGPRWRSWICGTDSFRLGPCAGSLVPLQYSMEFHCLGFPHHFKNEFHMSHNVPLHFFGSCPLLSNVFFVFFFELERSTWSILKQLFVVSSLPDYLQNCYRSRVFGFECLTFALPRWSGASLSHSTWHNLATHAVFQNTIYFHL